MNKRKLLIIGAVLVILVGILLALLSKDNGATTGPGKDNNSFPSGGSSLPVGGSDSSSNPFPGGTGSSTGNTSGGSGSGEENRGDDRIRGVKQVSKEPVVGATSFGTLKNVNLTLRYVEAGSGHIFDYRVLGNESRRISSATIPRVKEVIWGNSGQSALLRHTDERETVDKNYLLRIQTATGTTASVVGVYLPDNINSATAAPVGEENLSCPDYLTKSLTKNTQNDPAEVRKLQIFLNIAETGLYDSKTISAVVEFQKANNIDQTGNVGPLTRTKINSLYCARTGAQVVGGRLLYTITDSGKTTATIANFITGKGINIFTSPVSDWLVSWPTKNTLILSTKPSAVVLGKAYTAPATAASPYALLANLKPLIRDVRGLTVSANPDLSRVLYSQASAGSFETRILDVKSGQARAFPVNTFPQEKCVWDRRDVRIVYCAVPRGRITDSQPDSWYRGQSSFDDNIYRIDTETDDLELIYTEEGEGKDIKEIGLSEDSTILYFIDKKEGHLWTLPLVENL